ncbi:MAG: rcc01693 family protein [Pseudomonadota bacterium]
MTIDWSALYAFGLSHLRLSPDAFWALTPAELSMMAGLQPGSQQALGRGWFDALSAQFPDEGP